MKIIFKNEETFEYIDALETSTFYDNANRRMLQITMSKDAVSLEKINDILSDETNLTQITLVNEEENITNYYDDYQIKMSLTVKPEVIGQDENGADIKEERIVFKLGRLTTIEKQLKALGIQM